jgi:hypothetical protein
MAMSMSDPLQCLSQNEISTDRPNSNNSVTGRRFMLNFLVAPVEISIFIIPLFWRLTAYMTMPGFENIA